MFWNIYFVIGISILLTTIASLLPGKHSETLFYIALAGAVLMLGGSLVAYTFQEHRLQPRRKNGPRQLTMRVSEGHDLAADEFRVSKRV
jgi:hypothetical protein